MVMTLAAVAIIVGGVLFVPGISTRMGTNGPVSGARVSGGGAATSTPPPPTPPTSPPSPAPSASASASASVTTMTLSAGKVVLKIDGFFSWALLDRKTGKTAGANLAATSSTESMIKIWIVADYLRRLGDTEPPPGRLQEASAAIRDSDDTAAQSLYVAGGGVQVIDRLVQRCRLGQTEAVVPAGAKTAWWSYTRTSARDAVKMGACVRDGTAAGPKWTQWVLDQMARVRGTTAARDQHPTSGGGHWGIIDGLPAEMTRRERIAIKNGWTLRQDDGLWHVNCLAIADDWVLAVLLRYSNSLSLDYGADACARVAAQLVVKRTDAR
ncbi:hypothetical protein ACI2K4_04930 [Micromonospora sp. NPDC050397]|uniref:hypothetical protein n=1 Tax=Micromonospora sp. NPDC050397 TaxID=3364279 RepID=UPI00384BDD55